MPPRSIVVNPTTPSNTLSFNLPPGVTIDVESVLAAIDASGAGDTTATLTIADSSGAVIARKRQSEVVTAGTSAGSATWALRLADEAPVAPPPAGGIEFTANGVYGPVNTGDALDVETTVSDQTFDSHVHNIVLKAGRNGAGRQGRITISPTVQILGGDLTNLGTNQAELDVGTAAQPVIAAWARAYNLQLGGANTGSSAGDFKVLDHHGTPALLIRDAGGQDQLGVFNIGPVARQAVAGSRGGNVALANLLTALANYGLIIDNTTP